MKNSTERDEKKVGRDWRKISKLFYKKLDLKA
jgi:hypothetical protein